MSDFLIDVVTQQNIEITVSESANNVVIETPAAQGLQGAQGPIGPVGPQGPSGLNGDDGLNVYQGTNNPNNLFGYDGETWINVATGDVFKKITGIWTLQGNIIGPQGPTGPQGGLGPQGLTGPVGLSILYGTAIPTNAIGVDGDTYFRTTNGDFYAKETGTWVLKTNLTGPQGPQGIQGVQGIQGIQGIQGPQGIQGDTEYVGNLDGGNASSVYGGTFTIDGGGAA